FAVGHPYEQEYEDAEKPESIFAILPTGKRVDLTSELKEDVHAVGDQKSKVFKLAYKPSLKGDAVIGLNTSIYYGRKQTAYQDFLKTFVHVDRMDGWRQRTGQPVEIVPLTRPYGLQAGFVFTGQVMKGDKPAAGVEVEIEQYREVPPDPNALPPEPLITRVVVTDPNGVFSHTLPEEGWWLMAAAIENAGKVEKDGQSYSLNGLAALWVHVEK
ncbi:MAG: DUF4198 domain-containing protein, partial [Candidatus Hinthialibacter sp.]